MTEPFKLNRVQKVKAVFPGSLRSSQEVHLETVPPKSTKSFKRILRILLRSPWEDYDYVLHLDQGILAINKGSSFKIVTIQQFQCAEILQQSRMFSSIQHPNVASIYDVYCHDGDHFLIMEYLSVRISHLEIQKHELEEWEIATIISEVVLKAVVHISSLRISCKELSSDNIGLSLDGELKLIIDPNNIKHDPLHESPRMSQVLLDYPILAEIIEEMMLTSYHLASDDDRRSEEALSFLSCTLSGSLESLINHCFLKLAVSPRKLIPRIRYGYEISRGSARHHEE